MSNDQRIPIGIWWELGRGSRWTNEGVSRVVGFLIEGAAEGGKYCFHLAVRHGLGDIVREDLRQLQAVEGLDWLVWEPTEEEEQAAIAAAKGNPDSPAHDAGPAALAEFANATVPVAAWIVTFPHFLGALQLQKPFAALFPDALPYDFPLGWSGDDHWGEEGLWPSWRRSAAQLIARSVSVITFSRHVADRHLGSLFQVGSNRIRVVPLAPPDLAPLVPFVSGRRQSSDSRAAAADLLRSYARDQQIAYLQDYPFEEVAFVAGATQDRPTKNLGLSAEAIGEIVRLRRGSMKLFLTARLFHGEKWTRLPDVVAADQLKNDVVSLPDLPRQIHAALFHCATAVVHSSHFEGISGALPFFEALSVGTPTLLARGPHVDELLRIEPVLQPFLFDPYDASGLALAIETITRHRDDFVKQQSKAYERLRRRRWSEVAEAYAAAALGHDPQ